ncbi:NPCBM/NEW2 domain-containing protein [Streptomyces sp. NPDC089919]|uniref:NPCBM/NEW2 domain-containing protein n=1 Tax=Streptomyces sp. NPDC089919 TaxID=3155188 RepID=UPI00341958C2
MGTVNPKPWWQSEAFKVGLALALVGGLITVLTNLFSADDSHGAAGPQSGGAQPTALAPLSPTPTAPPGGDEVTRSPEPPPADTAEPTTAAPRTEPPESPPGDEPADPAPQPRIQYLAALDPVGGLGNWTRTGTVEMGGRTYGNSIVHAPSSFASGRLTVTYNIPPGMRHFKAVTGFDDRTQDGSAAFFQVERDRTPVDSGATLAVGEERTIDLDVAGARRLTIEVEVTRRPAGTVNAPFHAVWGDARFTMD